MNGFRKLYEKIRRPKTVKSLIATIRGAIIANIIIISLYILKAYAEPTPITEAIPIIVFALCNIVFYWLIKSICKSLSYYSP